MVQKIACILFIVVSIAGCSFNTKEKEQQKKYDAQRVDDVHHIARLVEDYYIKAGYYPLANKGLTLPIIITITNKKYDAPGPTVSFKKFYQELRYELGDNIKIPFDPDQNDTKSARLYQYYTDSASYEVSAFLYTKSAFTTALSKYSHKYQIGSIPWLKRKVYRLQDIDYIHEHGFDNAEDQLKLLDAVKNDNVDEVMTLIKKGVNLSPITGFNYKGQPLVYAVQTQNTKIMTLLIANGADPNGRNAYLDTPLIYATENPKKINTKVISILLEADADVNQPNAFGVSPFIGACAIGDLKLVQLMYKFGGDVQANYVSLTNQNTYKKNITPLQAAKESGHKYIVDFLKKKGAH